MLDQYGREINYLRVSITDKCNLRCMYCMPENKIRRNFYKDTLMLEDILKIVKVAEKIGIKKIRYTGGEPLMMEGLERLIYETNKLPGIEDISITTNGTLISDIAGSLKKAGLNRVNISLDTLNKDKFKIITGVGNIDRVFEGIEKCLTLGFSPVKINTVLMKGINDNEFDDFLNMTKELPVEVRFIELMPIGEGIKLYEERKLNFSELIKEHTELTEIETKKIGTAKMYKLKNSKGRIGFINPISCKFCSQCNKIRLTCTGEIRQCLHSKEEISLRQYLNNDESLTRILTSAIYSKQLQHNLDKEVSKSTKLMYQIGG